MSFSKLHKKQRVLRACDILVFNGRVAQSTTSAQHRYDACSCTLVLESDSKHSGRIGSHSRTL